MPHDPVRALHTAFELHEMGVAMKRQQLRRAFPEEDDAAIGRRLAAWLHTRPGAEQGDAEGRLVAWPRARGG